MRRRPAPAWPVALAVLLTTASLGLTTEGGTPRGRPVTSSVGPGARSSRPRPPVEAERDTAVRDLLGRRGAAVRDRDRAAFLATVDPASPDLRREQARLFDALAGVPLASWSYDLHPETSVGTGDRWAPRVTLRYALAGFDARPASLEQAPLFARRGEAWLLTGEDDRHTARDLWDFGPVVATRGRRSLVLAHPDQAGLAAELAGEADHAVVAVTAVVGRGWAQRVVVLVPADARELAALAQTTADLSAYAAVQSSELGTTGTGDPTPVGDRVAVDPTVYTRAGPRGRQVVLTHEVTHLATRADTGSGLPQWLVEGLADEIGFRDSGLAVARVAEDLAAEVRRGALPATLPTDDEFTGGSPRLAAVYAEAWLATRLLARRYGDAALLRLYRSVGRGDDLASALRRLGTTPDALTADWLAEVRGLGG